MNEPNSKPFDEKTRRSVKNEIFSQSPWPSSSSREPKPLRNRRDAEGLVSHPPHVPLAESIVQWVLRMANQKTVQPRTGKYDACGAHPGPSSKESSKLRKSPHDRRTSCHGFLKSVAIGMPDSCNSWVSAGSVGRRFRKTTDNNHKHGVAPNFLQRNFHAESPDQAWVADISYTMDHGRMVLPHRDRGPFLKTSSRMVDG